MAERFFGRAKNRRGVSREGIFASCPWKQEGAYGLVCYECHKELLRNPVLLPDEVSRLAELVKRRGLCEEEKTESRTPIAGRIALLQEVLALGIRVALKREVSLARRRAARELAPFLGGFALVLLLVGFSPWMESYASTENVAIEGWVFFLAGLLGCALTPAHPFRAGTLATIGVLSGTAAGLIVHSIVGSGREHEYFPLEVVSHAAMSAPSFLLSALVWAAGTSPIFWDMRELRELADANIQARHSAVLDSLAAEIEVLKNRAVVDEGPSVAETLPDICAACSNALYALAEAVLTQYDRVLAEPLVLSPFAVNGLIRAVPARLRPLLDECIAHVRRQTHLAGEPKAATPCTLTLEAKFAAICEDVALTLRASYAERNRDLLRSLASPFSGWLTKLASGGSA